MAVEFDVGSGEAQSPYFLDNKAIISEYEIACEHLGFSIVGKCNAWRLELEMKGIYNDQPIAVLVKYRHSNTQNKIIPVNNRIDSHTTIELQSNAGRPPFRVSNKKGWMLGKRAITILDPNWFYVTGGSIHENQLNDLRNWMLDWKDAGLKEVIKKRNEKVRVEFDGMFESSKEIIQLIESLRVVFIH
jgi:hypothetical protein